MYEAERGQDERDRGTPKPCDLGRLRPQPVELKDDPACAKFPTWGDERLRGAMITNAV
jgi:hypothetical protein